MVALCICGEAESMGAHMFAVADVKWCGDGAVKSCER